MMIGLKIMYLVMVISWNDSVDVTVYGSDGGVYIFPSQQNSHILYIAHTAYQDSLRIFKTTDDGQSWNILTSLDKAYYYRLAGLSVIPGDTLFVGYVAYSDGFFKLLQLDSQGNLIDSIVIDTVFTYPSMATDVEYFPSNPHFLVSYDVNGIIKNYAYGKNFEIFDSLIMEDTTGNQLYSPWIAKAPWGAYIVASSTNGLIWLFNGYTGFSGYFEYFDTSGGKMYSTPVVDVSSDGRVLITAFVPIDINNALGYLYYSWSTDWGNSWHVDSFMDTFNCSWAVPIVKNTPSGKWYIIANRYKNGEKRIIALKTENIYSNSWDTIEISYRNDVKIATKYINGYYIPNKDLVVSWSVFIPYPYATYFDREGDWTKIKETDDIISLSNLELKLTPILRTYGEFELTLLKGENISIKIVSIDGRVVSEVYNGKLSAGKYSFNICGLKPGVYVLLLKIHNSKLITKKFIVKQ